MVKSNESPLWFEEGNPYDKNAQDLWFFLKPHYFPRNSGFPSLTRYQELHFYRIQRRYCGWSLHSQTQGADIKNKSVDTRRPIDRSHLKTYRITPQTPPFLINLVSTT